MDIYSIVIIVGFALSLLLGYILGFGRTLKFITGGIVGVIVSVLVCVTFGGIIARASFVADLIAKGNEFFGSKAEFLAKINLATIIYYIVLFLLVQIIRIIIVKTISKIFTPKDKEVPGYAVRNVINRTLGLLLFGAAFVLLCYLVMALVKEFEDVEKVATFIAGLRDGEKKSLFYLMYSHNPIDFSVLFAKAAH